MATSLAEIRAKLKEQEDKKAAAQSGASFGDKAIYPHWNIPESTLTAQVPAVLRYLPDADPANTFFWVERAMIKLPFAGIKGQADSKPVIVQVPCMEMWNESCPVLAEVRPWFKDKSLEEMGRKYWKKRSYLYQGFVRENPLKDDATPENPIRRFIISTSIHNSVKGALMDPELEELPTDYVRGLDFRVIKTTKGGYADYSSSKWSSKPSALNADEQAAIEKFGLFNLKDFLPKKPSDVELKVIKEMFEASVDGQAFDADKWAQYYKPAGFKTGNDAAVATPAPAGEEAVDEETTPVAKKPAAPAPAQVVRPATTPAATKTDAASASKRAEDILAMIRSKQKPA